MTAVARAGRRRFMSVLRRAGLVVAAGVVFAACGDGEVGEPAETVPIQSTVAAATPGEETPAGSSVLGPAASDEIPSLDELIAIGLTTSRAECFLAEIDPDGTERVSSVEHFNAAFTACFARTE